VFCDLFVTNAEFGQLKSQANSIKNLTAKTIPRKKTKKGEEKEENLSKSPSHGNVSSPKTKKHKEKHSKENMKEPLLEKHKSKKRKIFCC
jgi:hypothetical protein